MKKLFVCSVLVLGLVITGCSSAQKKNPHLDGYWQGKGKSVSYKKFTRVKSWAPGQYVVMGNLDDGERKSIVTTTIIRREGGGWVFESITKDEDGKVSGMQMLIKGYEQAVRTNDASKISVVWAKMLQPDGTVQTLQSDMMMMYNVMLKSAWEKLIIGGGSYTKAGAVSVPAGNFSGTTKLVASVKILFTTLTQVNYLHPDVPVNGLVKATKEDGEVLQVLLDYGYNGKAVIK